MVGEVRGPCILLTKDENDQVTRLLGHLCQSVATTVVQLFKRTRPDDHRWLKRSEGVLCLVKDSQRRSFFLRLYCLVRNSLIWEHELRSNMEYNASNPLFHVFEAEGCSFGFVFFIEEEARGLHNIIHDKIEERRRRRQERQSRQHQQPEHTNTLPSRMGASNFNSGSQSVLYNGLEDSLGLETQTSERHPKEEDKRGKRGKRRNITKNDIGLPSNFRHLTHIGWNPNTGFALNDVADPDVQQLFRQTLSLN